MYFYLAQLVTLTAEVQLLPAPLVLLELGELESLQHSSRYAVRQSSIVAKLPILLCSSHPGVGDPLELQRYSIGGYGSPIEGLLPEQFVDRLLSHRLALE